MSDNDYIEIPDDEERTGNSQPQAFDWPTLAQEAYHGLAGEVVARLLPNTEADPVALLMQFLTAFGNAVGRQPYYLVEQTRHFGNLFAVLVGSTAKARKGTAADRVLPIFEIADREWSNDCAHGGISSGEGIIWSVRDPIYKLDRSGQPQMTDAGIADKRLLLDERELSGLLTVMRREGNIVSRVLRDAWDCRHMLSTLTKNSPARSTEAYISLVGHITIDELRDQLDRTSMANGFANRFIYVCVRRSKLLPNGGAPSDISTLGIATREALETARSRERIDMTEAAARYWREIYPELSREQPGLFGSIIARAEAQTIRFALLYALLDSAPQIDDVHLRAAAALWSFCEASAGYVFGNLTGDPLSDLIWHFLCDSGPVGMTRTEISNAVGRHYRASKISEALSKLEATGKARCVSRTMASGRTVPVWLAITK